MPGPGHCSGPVVKLIIIVSTMHNVPQCMSVAHANQLPARLRSAAHYPTGVIQSYVRAI